MRRGAGSAVLGCAGGLVLVITALALALSSRQHSSMLVDSEWAGGSSRWAQSDTPVSSSTPSQSARWAQSDTPLAAPPQSDAWSAFRKSQSFLPARLQKHSPEGGVETDGNRAQRRAGPVSRSGAEQDAIEADAAELIKKAGENNAEAIMHDEAVALQPLWSEQSGEQRSLRVWVAAQARLEREKQKRAAEAQAMEARERELEARGFFPKAEQRGDEEEEYFDNDDGEAAEDAETRRQSYERQGFSPIRNEFAGSPRGADWGGIQPVGFVPVQPLGYPMEPKARAREQERSAAASAAAALARQGQPSFQEQGFLPKDDTLGGIEAPADPAAAAWASSAQWRRSRRAQADAAAAGAAASADMPFHAQGFQPWVRDDNLGWGDEVVRYKPPDLKLSLQDKKAAEEAAGRHEGYLRAGMEPTSSAAGVAD